jgi:hypothetical protein
MLSVWEPNRRPRPKKDNIVNSIWLGDGSVSAAKLETMALRPPDFFGWFTANTNAVRKQSRDRKGVGMAAEATKG